MLDWNEVRFFLAIARSGTIAKAARSLGVDQTTVARRLAGLEETLQVALFARSTSGYVLTPAGERVLASAERMEAAANELAAQAIDDAAPIAGIVRIATTETIADRFVVPALREVQRRHPQILAHVSTGWQRVDLIRGEADLAIRLVKPTDPRLAFRKLGEAAFRLYASHDYVARSGPPTSLAGHPLLAYDEPLRAGGPPFQHVSTKDAVVALQTNSVRVLVAAAIAGLGIVQLPSYVGDEIADLARVVPEHDARYRIWLVVPQAKRRVGAVRVVGDAIAAAFERAE